MPDNRKLILVADDDPGMRMILGHILAAEGYAVINTDNGRSALEMAQSEHPDLMILDLNILKLLFCLHLYFVNQYPNYYQFLH